MLQPIAGCEGLWEARQELPSPGGVLLPTRMTVARLADASLWVHSPFRIGAALEEELRALGTVRHLVAPTTLPGAYLAQAAERFPEAQVYVAPGASRYLGGAVAGVPLRGPVQTAWADVLDMQVLQGMPANREMLFLHRPSRTLICSDLVFNIRHMSNAATSSLLYKLGTCGRLAASQMLRRTVNDPAAFWDSLRSLHRWTFHRIVMLHGEVFESPHAYAVLVRAVEASVGPDLWAVKSA